MKRKVIGLLGGIGAGKTTVGRLFGELGADVLAADAMVHRFLRRAAVRARIAAALGQALPEDAAALRQALAARIFSSPEDRRNGQW